MNGQIKLISKMDIKTYDNFKFLIFFMRDSYVKDAHIQKKLAYASTLGVMFIKCVLIFLSALLQRNQFTANISKPL